jgi:ATP-dependent Clp protease ATP-binding subunit ClpB
MPAKQQFLDISKHGKQSEELYEVLENKLIGQEHVIDTVREIYTTWISGMYDHNRPIRTVFLGGPTGTGKTRLVELFAETIIKEYTPKESIVRINCAEFQHDHEIAKLIGAPPSYLGHRETVALLSQAVLDKCHTDKLKVTVILFDEIEKASLAVAKLLLGILDKANLNLGDNRKVDFTKCFIFMTSNLGAIDYTKLNYGFENQIEKENQKELADKTILSAMKSKFSPEFMNRLDDILFFHPLYRESLERILDLEMNQIRQDMAVNLGIDKYFTFRLSKKAKDYILDNGTDLKYGARYLKRAIDKLVLRPFSNLLASEQIKGQDEIYVDYLGGETLKFKID